MNTPDTSTPFAAQSLSKSYGAHTALSDVSLALPAGRVIGLLGRNGAGGEGEGDVAQRGVLAEALGDGAEDDGRGVGGVGGGRGRGGGEGGRGHGEKEECRMGNAEVEEEADRRRAVRRSGRGGRRRRR